MQKLLLKTTLDVDGYSFISNLAIVNKNSWDYIKAKLNKLDINIVLNIFGETREISSKRILESIKEVVISDEIAETLFNIGIDGIGYPIIENIVSFLDNNDYLDENFEIYTKEN